MSPVLKAPITGLPCIKAPTTVSNAISFEPDGWTSTPLLRRAGHPSLSRTEFLVASMTAVLLSGYFVLRNSDRPDNVVVALRPPSVASLLRQVDPSVEARGTTVESQTEPDVPTASLQPTARADTKPTDNGSLPQTLPESGKRLLAESGYDSGCYLSASAVRQNHPGGRPSWTMRVAGHEGTKCWYPATQTVAEADAPSARARSLAVESRAEPEVQTPSSQSTERLDVKPTESGIEARPPQTLPESGHRSTCYQSASDVRQNHPGAWPSWTLRTPGHEGTRCWYAGARTGAHDHSSEMRRDSAIN
jgi:hypothetical protein